MATRTFHLTRTGDSPVTTGFSGKHQFTIDRAAGTITKAGGYSGGDLFMLSLAGCFTGDLFWQAGQKGLKVDRVDLDMEVDWGPEDACAESIKISTTVEAQASEKEILDLVQWADNDSTIFRTVRKAIPFTLSPVKAIPTIAPAQQT